MLSTLNSLLRITCVLFLIAPTSIALAYHVPTQAPSNLTLTVDYENGTVKADWDASDQMEDYPAERYAIGFGLSDDGSMPYGIATGNVGDSNALNTEYTFTASYLNAVFNEAHGLFHVKIRSDNDTNASYSEWTPTVSVTIQNKPASVTLASYDMNREDGIKFEWSASTSGFVSASTYKMYYKLSNASEWTLEGQQSNTDYVLAWSDLTNDTYDFMLSACGSENDCNDSNTLTIDVVTYVAPTTTSSTTTTTTSTTTTTTTTLPPPPPTTTTTTLYVVVMADGTESEYTESEVNDGTVERDQERIDNEKEYGCFMTNAQIERGDCIIIIESEIIEDKEEYEEQKSDTEEELFNDDDVVLEVVVEDEVEELESIEDKDIVEEEIKIDINNIKEEFEFEEEEIVIEIIEDVIIEIVEDEIVEDELVEEVFTDESEAETEVQEQDTPVKEEEVELTEEEVKIEVAELEEVIEEIVVIDIPKVTEEELEEFTEEELIEYEEAKEEAIEEFVEELETEEVVEILEQVNDVGLDNIAEVSQEVIEVVAQVVEEAITIAQEEELTQEQTEVVAEVLGFKETKDVQIIAEAVKTDENVAQAVDEFVERAVEFAKTDSDQEFTLADATTEIAFESFVASPVSVIIDIDLDAINLNNIANDMTTDQKEKAQEVIVPTILVRIVSLAMRRFD